MFRTHEAHAVVWSQKSLKKTSNSSVRGSRLMGTVLLCDQNSPRFQWWQNITRGKGRPTRASDVYVTPKAKLKLVCAEVAYHGVSLKLAFDGVACTYQIGVARQAFVHEVVPLILSHADNYSMQRVSEPLRADSAAGDGEIKSD
eukprot:8845122-Pyramimonas_sp.AAC.1